ncbi:glycosyltransferase [Paenibacillus rigui]|uniref:Glycosyl transferase family 1 n=1 Tax=Paenibacillus rigui TaxID=554312 RepID=A0A229UQH6_9BACL|nr:glycosyltransferase [Paenibacillus rigui]OXM85634.1 glycosyl transferase family 1 [Paenibacillus rigui]
MIIIYPPTIDWGWMKQRPQQLMTRLARNGHTVFFCNPTRADRPIERIEPNLYVVHQYEQWLAGPWPEYRRNAGSHTKVVVWCSFPKLAASLQACKPDFIVYDCVDEFAQWQLYEPMMLRLADAVVCASERLFYRMKRSCPDQKIHLIRNAYDTDMGLHVEAAVKNKYGLPGMAPLPPDLPENGLKRIGYIGAWAPWVDDALLRKLADAIPEAELIIIGPSFGKPYPRHVNNGRLRFLGLKYHGELPSYLEHLSVLLLPFRIEPITLSTNPVKLYEYLATGKPVVSTALPEAMQLVPEVDVALTHQAFITKVLHRLRDPGSRSSRRALALQHTWEHRASQVEIVLEQLQLSDRS